jgi:Rrf2 family nitric oxide-sensitive transcriptional repressor
MRLTVHSDYALRLLMLLAMEPGRRHTIEEAARRYRVSGNHLKKVAQTLVQAGFIDSHRGRNGGLQLSRPPEKVNIGAVIRATEDDFALVECFDPSVNRCIATPGCGLRGPFEEALRAFLHVLDGYTLADLIRSPAGLRRMRRLLAEAAGPAARV